MSGKFAPADAEQSSRPDFPDADEVLTEAIVNAGLISLAGELQKQVDQKNCILLGILSGGLFPLSRLTQLIKGDYRLDFCLATRYAGATSGGQLEWLLKPRLDMTAATVIVIDDIYDAGITLNAVADYCRQHGAGEVLTATLFIKDCKRAAAAAKPDFHAELIVPDRYVFGCGMDLHERWRHLPSVYALSSSD